VRSCKEQGRELDEELEKGKLGIRESRRKQMKRIEDVGLWVSLKAQPGVAVFMM